MTIDPTPARRRRAQTQVDFVVAAGLLLLVFGLAVGAVVPLVAQTPQSTSDAGAAADQITADRVAAWVVDLLGEPTDGTGTSAAAHASPEPGTLSPVCSVAFFTADERLAAGAGCPFTRVELNGSFGVDGVRIAVYDPGDRPGIDRAIVFGVETSHGHVAGRLTRSATTESSTRSTDSSRTGAAASSRVVTIDGEAYVLTVWVW